MRATLAVTVAAATWEIPVDGEVFDSPHTPLWYSNNNFMDSPIGLDIPDWVKEPTPWIPPVHIRFVNILESEIRTIVGVSKGYIKPLATSKKSLERLHGQIH